ncbi:MAG: hypothetical protein K2P84_12210 [Undibacterium sp.]|nr:hypothetical protein [Undibacterium sp.]
MIKKSPIALAALVLLLGTASVTSFSTQSYAQQKEEKVDPLKLEVIRSEWDKPYKEIQKLIEAKQYAEALEKVNTVFELSDKKTPYELFFIQRTKAVLASSMNDHAALADAFDQMIKSDFSKLEEKIKYSEGIAGIFYNATKYPEAIAWSNRTLSLDNKHELARQILSYSLYFSKDYAKALPEFQRMIAADDAAKRVPALERYRLTLSTQQHLKDLDGIEHTLERIVTSYPSKEYWLDLLYRVPNKPTFSDRLRLDWYRLMLNVDGIEDADQYMEMAELAMLVGLPLEAKAVLEVGFKANILGVGKNGAKHKPYLDKVTKQAAEDTKTLDKGEADAKAAKSGLGMVNMGYNFVIQGQHERGIKLMEDGIAKGGLKAPEEAKLHLGMAYLKAGNRAKAEEVLKSVQGKDGGPDIARYWLLMK